MNMTTGTAIANVSIREMASALGYNEDLSDDIVATVISPDLKFNSKDNAIKYTVKIYGIIIILVTKGEMRLKVDYTDYTIKAGAMIHIMPEHVVTFLGRDEETTAICLMVSPDFMRLKFGERQIEESHPDISHYIFLKNNPKVKLTANEIRAVTVEFNRIKKSLKKTGYFKKPIVRNALFGFLLAATEILYSKADINEFTPIKRKDTLFENFLNTLNRDIRKRHDVNYYASQLYVSPQYLTATLRHVSGKSTREWIEEMLIVEAKKLMNSKKHSIQEISNILNFKDQSTFGKLFKRKTGITPSQYITE